jgi:flavodoxin
MPKHLTVIYASTSGNTEIVMETIAQVLGEYGFRSDLHRAEKTPISVIRHNHLFVFGTSTWEHGALNPFFRKLLKEMKAENLTGKSAVFVGCGDTRYEPVLFCEGIEKVRQVWEKQGGQTLGSILKIDGEPYPVLASDVTMWAESVAPLITAVPIKKNILSVVRESFGA